MLLHVTTAEHLYRLEARARAGELAVLAAIRERQAAEPPAPAGPPAASVASAPAARRGRAARPAAQRHAECRDGAAVHA